MTVSQPRALPWPVPGQTLHLTDKNSLTLLLHHYSVYVVQYVLWLILSVLDYFPIFLFLILFLILLLLLSVILSLLSADAGTKRLEYVHSTAICKRKRKRKDQQRQCIHMLCVKYVHSKKHIIVFFLSSIVDISLFSNFLYIFLFTWRFFSLFIIHHVAVGTKSTLTTCPSSECTWQLQYAPTHTYIYTHTPQPSPNMKSQQTSPVKVQSTKNKEREINHSSRQAHWKHTHTPSFTHSLTQTDREELSLQRLIYIRSMPWCLQLPGFSTYSVLWLRRTSYLSPLTSHHFPPIMAGCILPLIFITTILYFIFQET